LRSADLRFNSALRIPKSEFKKLGFDKTFQLLRPAGMSQFPQCLGLNLSNSFPGDIEILSHFFQGMVILLPDAKSHPQDFLFSVLTGLS